MRNARKLDIGFFRFKSLFWTAGLVLVFSLAIPAGVLRAEMWIRDYDEARHSRFYQGVDKNFIGEGQDFSGVGRANVGATWGQWATMVSDSFFVTAEHWAPGVGSTVTFYEGNDHTAAHSYTVAQLYSTTSSDGKVSDTMLGRLTSTVDVDIERYSVVHPDANYNYAGREATLYGNEQSAPGTIAGRVGVNTVEYTELYASSWNRTSEVAWYQYNEWFNDDEAQVIGGDSGAPSFVDHNGQQVLIGTHWLGYSNTDPTPPPWGQWGADVLLSDYARQMNAIMGDFDESLTMASGMMAWDPGDANKDGVVDAADFSILAANWQGTDKLWGEGDFSLDGLVDAADFSLLAANWQGGAAPLAEFQASLSQAPEPATMSLLALGSLALLRRKRR